VAETQVEAPAADALTAPAAAELPKPAFEFIEDIPAQVDPDRIVLESMIPAAPEVATPTAADPLPAPADLAPGAVAVVPPVGTLEPAAVVATEPAVEAPPAAAPLLPPEIGELLEQNMVPVALGGVLVLALIGLIATRGRRREPEQEAVLPAAAALPDEFPVDQPAVPPRVLDELPESGFLDDFSPSELNALQDETGEVDPVSEADVYIAYGRYQQAEELLGQAMQRDPGRLALKHKLLEVHYATRNADKFAALAKEMAEAGQDAVDEDAWARAQDMGRELQPDNPLFALPEGETGKRRAAHAGGAMLGGAAAMVDDDTLSLDELELSELKAAYDEAESQESQLDVPSEVSILLDLDEASSLASRPTPQAPEPIPFEEVESLDFTLPVAEQDSASKRGDDKDTINDAFDLDSMMAQAEAVVDGSDTSLSLDSAFSAEELQAQLDELSDLSALDSAFEQEVPAPEFAEPRNLGLVTEDRSDLPGGVDQPMRLDDALETDDLVGEGAEILQFEPVAAEPVDDDADDVTTKLDLARAYYEMGDEDGARSILEEVVAEGNDHQRDDAERLLAKLG
jgi:pilus assembly protein FimV